MNKRTSLVSFLLVLLFAAAADGLMDVFGPRRFLVVGAVVMGAAWALLDYYNGGS